MSLSRLCRSNERPYLCPPISKPDKRRLATDFPLLKFYDSAVVAGTVTTYICMDLEFKWSLGIFGFFYGVGWSRKAVSIRSMHALMWDSFAVSTRLRSTHVFSSEPFIG